MLAWLLNVEQACGDICAANVFVDMCQDIAAPDMCVDMCVGMCVGMCVCMCVGMCVNMCVDMCAMIIVVARFGTSRLTAAPVIYKRGCRL